MGPGGPCVPGGAGLEIAAPVRPELRPAARVLGEAFLDDPVWTAIGPRRRAHRCLSNRLAFAGILAGSRRNGARIRVAREGGGEIVGASIAFEPGRWPMPDGSVIWELGWLGAAGPLPARRGLRNDRAMRAEHVAHPHLYLWFLGVLPARHRSGVGRALLAELHAASDSLAVPTYLETATPANVGFYERDGYEIRGRIQMPFGPAMWRMERPAGGGRPARP